MDCHWLKTPDGLRLRVLRWTPEQKPRCDVLLLHGHGEHAMRHHDGMLALAKAGYQVTGWDQRGHGCSTGRRGWIASYNDLLEDAHLVITNFIESARPRPLYLFGHSMGGQLALHLALDQPEHFAGVVVSAPWLRLKIQPPRWKVLLARWAATRVPWLTLSTGVHRSQLSADPQISLPPGEARLLHRRMSARMFQLLSQGGSTVLDRADSLRSRCLVIQGEEDPIMDPAAAQEFARRAGKPCSLLMLPGVRHEPHNDPIRYDVTAQIIAWLAAA